MKFLTLILFFIPVVSFSQKVEIKEYGDYLRGTFFSDSNKIYFSSNKIKFKFYFIRYKEDSCWFELPKNKIRTKAYLALESTKFYEIKRNDKKKYVLLGVMGMRDNGGGGMGNWTNFFVFKIDPITHKLIKYREKEYKGFTPENFKKMLKDF